MPHLASIIPVVHQAFNINLYTRKEKGRKEGNRGKERGGKRDRERDREDASILCDPQTPTLSLTIPHGFTRETFQGRHGR